MIIVKYQVERHREEKWTCKRTKEMPLRFTKPPIEYFERMQNEYPNKDITFVRAIAEGNLVALHTHQTWPNDIEYVTMDFFRFDHNGKIVEHWDALQEIPKETLNGHTMY